jgi:hypothetical protein
MQTTQRPPPPDPGVEYIVAAILTIAAVGSGSPINTPIVINRYGDVLQALRESGLLPRP